MFRVAAYLNEPLLESALRECLARESDVELVCVCSEPEDYVAQVRLTKPEIALVSFSHSVDLLVLTEVSRWSPATRTIIWVSDISVEFAHQALEQGVRGILRRSLPVPMLLKCLRKVNEGELWCENALTANMLNGRVIRISAREGELIYHIASGLKNKEVADAMSITEGTVKVYLSRLFIKTGAKDRYELALFGIRNLQLGPEGEGAPTFVPRSLFITPGRGPKPPQAEFGGTTPARSLMFGVPW